MKVARLIGLSWFVAAALCLDICPCPPPVCAQRSEDSIGYQSVPSRRPNGQLLDLDQARQYMLDLINRDRSSVGARPVVLDQVGNAAGQLHSDEMAEFGYLAHWTMDGRKPDQRYTECGGKDSVAENVDATKTSNPQQLPLCKNQVFSKHDLEEVEGQFFNEKPPNDGHRVNIIDPNHTGVGIGLSMAGDQPGADDGFPRMACAQEFINHYGTYGDIPQAVAPGDSLTVEGTLAKGLHLQSVDLRREKLPEPMTIEALDKTYSYSIPDSELFSYFPPPYVSPAPVTLTTEADCEHFSLQIQTTKDWQPGLYYVCIWVTIPGQKEADMVSTRTFSFGATAGNSRKRPPQDLSKDLPKDPSENTRGDIYRLKRP